ncbi:hypothetical protein RI129_010443 [Pyrocoelia pectoralis]|uniref:Protein sleepless n=1 Tax=Pyrocoelia pectoralis TaxID=417401 RepID=A0AAN7VBA5_9COLE
MATFRYLIVIFVCIQSGYALKCYKCNSQTMDGCKKGSQNLQETTCSLEHPDFNQFCLLKFVYDEQQNKDNVLSGCETAPKSTSLNKNITQCQTDGRYRVKECIVCDSELCNYTNSGSSIETSILCAASLFILSKLLS